LFESGTQGRSRALQAVLALDKDSSPTAVPAGAEPATGSASAAAVKTWFDGVEPSPPAGLQGRVKAR